MRTPFDPFSGVVPAVNPGRRLPQGLSADDFRETFRRHVPKSELDSLQADAEPEAGRRWGGQVTVADTRIVRIDPLLRPFTDAPLRLPPSHGVLSPKKHRQIAD